MKRAPLLVPAVCFVIGVITDAHGVGVASVALAAALAIVRRDAAIALCCGVCIGALRGHPAVIDRDYRTARYAGTVVGDVRLDERGAAFPLALTNGPVVRAFTRERVGPGEQLRVRGRLAPFDEPRNPGEPSARAIALDDGLAGELAIDRVLERRRPDLRDPRVWMPVVRARASAIVHARFPEPQATVLAGALWGERGTLPPAVRDDFQATGTVHVLVTAGLHLGVIAALLSALCGLAGISRGAAAFGTIPVLYAYAWFSGWHLPSQRAAAMLSVALLARACGARAFSLNTLAVAAIAVAAAWPVAVESVSFALSFSCVASIVLFAEPIARRLTEHRVLERIAEALALTLATQIGVWPLTAATFFTIAPYAVLANAIVVPLVGITMTLGLAAIALSPVALLGAIAARWDTWLLTAIVGVTHAVATLPGARLTIAPPPPWSIAIYDVAAVLAAAPLRRNWRVAAAVVAAASTVVVLAATMHGPHGLTITALDVGQADAIVIRTPHDHTILIDAGGKLERGPAIGGRSPAEASAERVVLPYLRRAGISRIDLMVLTHPHGDHVGGFAGIVRDFDVREIYDSGQSYGGRAFNDGVHEAHVHHVPMRVVRCGDNWASDDGITLSVLSPCGALFVDGRNDVNENSIIVVLAYGGFRMLFTGDAGFQAEQRLLQRGVDLHADVLKVGHHGSSYSSSPAFLAAVRPRYALVSVGRRNMFGHPSPMTIEHLRDLGTTIYRTDRCGAITFEPATILRVETMIPSVEHPVINKSLIGVDAFNEYARKPNEPEKQAYLVEQLERSVETLRAVAKSATKP